MALTCLSPPHLVAGEKETTIGSLRSAIRGSSHSPQSRTKVHFGTRVLLKTVATELFPLPCVTPSGASRLPHSLLSLTVSLLLGLFLNTQIIPFPASYVLIFCSFISGGFYPTHTLPYFYFLFRFSAFNASKLK